MGIGTYSCRASLTNFKKRRTKTCAKQHGNSQARLNDQDNQNATFDVQNLSFVGIIGRGTYGKVYLAYHPAHKIHYAAKVIPKKYIDKKRHPQILTERSVLTKLGPHPFFIHLHYAVQTVDHLCLIMDYVSGGELYYHIRKNGHFTEPQAMFFSAEIAIALGYLHRNNIIYRDLKPENVLLSEEGHIILIDFGLCKENVNSTSTVSTICGTPEYLAPEIIKKEAYTRAVDWWGLGIVLYELLYGYHPFQSRNISVMYSNILKHNFKLKETTSEFARDILEKLLQKDPNERLGFGELDVEEIKEHDFFLPLEWDEIERKQVPPPYLPNTDYADHRKKSLKRQSFNLMTDINQTGNEDDAGLYAGFSPVN